MAERRATGHGAEPVLFAARCQDVLRPIADVVDVPQDVASLFARPEEVARGRPHPR
jgi:hypothetical protein